MKVDHDGQRQIAAVANGIAGYLSETHSTTQLELVISGALAAVCAESIAQGISLVELHAVLDTIHSWTSMSIKKKERG